MAVHKVPQDVEADDKFLGPLSFKQFLFFGGAIITGYLIFATAQKGVWPVSVAFFFPFLGFAALAFPWSKEQPTEIWLAARLRFFLKPRRRIWNQAGVKDLVTITVPKKEAHAMTDGLNQAEVRSRFSALATVIDSRGWAVKNYVSTSDDEESDRLVAGTTAAPTELETIAKTADDVLEDRSSVVAKQFDTMIQQSEIKHKSETQRLIEEARAGTAVNEPALTTEKTSPSSQTDNIAKSIVTQKNTADPSKKGEDFWFLNQTGQPQNMDPNFTTFSAAPVIKPGATQATTQSTNDDNDDAKPIDENSILETIHQKQARDKLQTGSSHGRILQPLGATPSPATMAEPDLPKPVINTQPIPPKNPDIINLARNNDLNVATLAREANKTILGDDEVVISLH